MNTDSDLTGKSYSAGKLHSGNSMLKGSQVNYVVDGNEYEGFYISPSDQAPLVLLVHDWNGLDDYEMTRARMLAEEGHAVFAVDMFGAGVRPDTMEAKREQIVSLYQNREKMRALVFGALDKAQSLGANINNLSLTGYCFGGAVVLEMARAGLDAKGFVTFHGALQTPDHQNYSKTKGSIVVLHGTADTAVTLNQFMALAKELEHHGVVHEMITYGGAPHAFTVFGSPNYHEMADKRSWERYLHFLNAL